jgi:hypothetical protein
MLHTAKGVPTRALQFQKHASSMCDTRPLSYKYRPLPVITFDGEECIEQEISAHDPERLFYDIQHGGYISTKYKVLTKLG